jgi:hypothetical protein
MKTLSQTELSNLTAELLSSAVPSVDETVPGINKLKQPVSKKLSRLNNLRQSYHTDISKPHYDRQLLEILDGLQCPVLLLPRLTTNGNQEKVGFFTDILFTSKETVSTLTKVLKSDHSNIIVFNIAESSLPDMDAGYASRLFRDTFSGMGDKIQLVNINKAITTEALERILDQHQITMVAALQKRKDILYRLASL